jgi:hypothetical protein
MAGLEDEGRLDDGDGGEVLSKSSSGQFGLARSLRVNDGVQFFATRPPAKAMCASAERSSCLSGSTTRDRSAGRWRRRRLPQLHHLAAQLIGRENADAVFGEGARRWIYR